MAENSNILHIDTQGAWRGGEAQVFALCRGLLQRGYPINVITQPDSALAARLRQSGIEPVEIPMRGEFDLLAAFRIREICRSRDIHIIHAHDARAHALSWIATMARTPIPVLVTRRVDFPVGGNLLSALKYKSNRIYFIAISNGVKKVLIDGGVPEDRIEIVFSGVDPMRFQGACDGSSFKMEYGIGEDRIIIGNIAALTDHKGQIYLIDAAPRILERFPNARFFIIGKGELKPSLQNRIDRLGLREKITLTGFIQNVGDALAAMDLFVLSSHLEGLCTSLLDAMSMKVPVVATRAGGIPDVVEHEVHGLLVEPKNPDSLAAAVIRMLEDKEAQRRFVEAGYEKVMQFFTTEQMIKGTIRVYEKILKEKGYEKG
jgi:glycosyltransferase involved in cell wall biosynthesis